MKNFKKMFAGVVALGLVAANSSSAFAATATSSATTVQVTVDPTVTISSVLPVTMVGNLTPNVEQTGSSTFSVSSNDATGYKIQTKIENACAANTNHLILGDNIANCGVDDKQIPTDGSDAANYFKITGYAVADANGASAGGNTASVTADSNITTVDAELVDGAAFGVTNQDDITVSYATQVDSTKAAGAYNGTIVYTIVSVS